MEHIKFYILTLLALSACSLFQPKEEVKFKNPIFYQRMSNGSMRQPFDVMLTPTTEQTFLRGESQVLSTDTCELLKNTENRILTKCCNEQKKCRYAQFTVASMKDESDSEYCIIIEQWDFDSPTFEFCTVAGYHIKRELLPNHDCGPTKVWDYLSCQWID